VTLAEEPVRQRRRQYGLKAGNERGETGRHGMGNRHRRAAEIDAMNQDAGDDAVQDTRAIRPRGPRDRGEYTQQNHHQRHPQRLHREGLCALQRVFRADEACAPQQHEHCRRRPCCETVKPICHLRRCLPERMMARNRQFVVSALRGREVGLKE
jgi:hypothetical protein